MSSAGNRRSALRGEPTLYERGARRPTRGDVWAWEEAVRRVEAAEARPRAPLGEQEIVAALSEPALYPDAPDAVEVRETHISWVFLAGERAYKLKKPVVLPFLDYGTVARRREMCEREVALNRRLAPDVYLGVRALARSDGRLALVPASGNAIDYLVEMRRFDESDTLAAAVERGEADESDVASVGRRLAAFHAAAAACEPAEDPLVAVKRIADGNFEMLLDGRGPLDARRVLAAQRFADAYLVGRAASVRDRAAAGRVREGHGDLRAEHVLLGEQVRIVDCTEFDRRLREIDVGADLAFLVMDLHRLARPDLAQALVAAYRAGGGDPGDDRLIAFHAALRAWVRAKIAVLRSLSPGAPPEHAAQARALLELGERFAWQARGPLAVIVCGPPASGKSHLAQALGRRSGYAIAASDETRKRLAGVAPTDRAPAEAYAPEAGERTYAELGRIAGERVGRDGGAIVDATFAHGADRRAFAAAFAGRAPVVVLECRAPAHVIAARAQARELDPVRVSDAGPEIAARLRADFEPLEDAVPAADHLCVRTDRDPDEVLDGVLALLDERLAGAGAHDGSAGHDAGTAR